MKELQEQFLQFLVQKSGAKSKKELEDYVKSLGEDGLQKAYEEFAQVMQKQAKKAQHGTKLQYFRFLKNRCAEDEELYYYKKGGSLGCGCKKKEDGGEVVRASMGVIASFKEDQKKKKEQQQPQKLKWTDAKEKELKTLSEKKTLTSQEKQRLQQLRNEFKNSSNTKDYELEEGKKGMKVEKDCGGSTVIAKFKAKCGTKMKKHEQGGSLNGVPFYQDGGKNKKSINDYYLTDYSEPNIQQKAKLNGKELTIKVNKGQQKGEDPITIQGNNYYLKGDSTLVKDNSIPYSFQQLRNAGINKKYNGGSLNGVPFYQAGTPKGGIRYGYTIQYPKSNSNFQSETFSSVPDKFGRHIEITRTISPRQDGTFNNDTTYVAQSMNGDQVKGSSWNYRNNGRVYIPNNSGDRWMTPGKLLGRNQFKNWGDYFEYLLSLRNK